MAFSCRPLSGFLLRRPDFFEGRAEWGEEKRDLSWLARISGFSLNLSKEKVVIKKKKKWRALMTIGSHADSSTFS